MLRTTLFCAIALAWLSGCTHLFLHPSKELVRTPKDIELDYQDFYFPSGDGNTLHGWFLPAQQPATATILFLHGNAENISTHIGSVYWLPAEGFNVFLFDYRGYGLSTGSATIAGIHQDIEAAITALLQAPQRGSTPVIVFGQSLGGALAIYAVAHSPQRQHIKGLIVESSFSDYRDIAREKFASLWLTWPFQWPLSLTISNQFSPIQSVKSVHPIPLLIIHGDQDRIVPPHHGRRLYEAAANPKELWIVPRGRHIQAFASKAYRERFVEYVKQLIPE